MSNLLCSTVLVLSVLLAGTVQAELVTMSFTGVTSNVVGNPLGLNLEGGEPITGIFTYDTTSTIQNPPLGFQEIYTQNGGASTSYEITIDGNTVLTPFTNDWFVFIGNIEERDVAIPFSGSDFWSIGHGASPAGAGSVAVNGIENTSIGFSIGLSDLLGAAFPGTLATLPNPLPGYEAYTDLRSLSNTFDLPFSNGRIQDGATSPIDFDAAQFSVFLTSFHLVAAVPEPNAVALLWLGSLSVFGFRRYHTAGDS